MYIKCPKTKLFINRTNNVDQKPMLFMHGFTGNSSSWNSITPFIKNRNCITIDLPGHGKSTFNKGIKDYDFKDWSEDLFIVLKHLGIKIIDICGYSMGGRLAIAFSAYYPNMIHSLILESTRLGIDKKGEKRNRIKNDNMQSLKILNNYALFIKSWEDKSFFKKQKQRNLKEWIRQKNNRISHNPEQLALSIKYLGLGKMPKFRNEFINFNFPIYIINGNEDNTYVEIGKQIRRLNKNVVQYIINDANHNTHIEKLDDYVNIISSLSK